MIEIIDPDLIFNILNQAEKYRLSDTNFPMIGSNDRMTDEELANAFIQHYEQKRLTLGGVK